MPTRIKVFLFFFTLTCVGVAPSARAQKTENVPVVSAGSPEAIPAVSAQGLPPASAQGRPAVSGEGLPSVSAPSSSTSTPLTVPMGGAGSSSSDRKNSWHIDGQVIFDLKAHQKPSGQAGIAAFQVPWISLAAVRDFDDDVEFRIEILAATPTTGTTEINFRQVAVKLPHVLNEATDLEVGLISHSLFTTQADFWAFRRAGPEFAFPLQRYGYLPDTDYGFQLTSDLTDSWSIGVAMTNGEGRARSESGTRKDVALWLAREWTENRRSWLVSFFGVRGGYENLPVESSNRDRTQISVATSTEEGASVSAEYNWAWDPADGLHNQAADQVNLTPFAGTRVTGVGYAFQASYAWRAASGVLWSLFTRSDHWEPIKGDGNYAINSSQLGVVYKPRPNLQWLVYNSLTSYGQLHSTAARDQQSWRITLDLRFD